MLAASLTLAAFTLAAAAEAPVLSRIVKTNKMRVGMTLNQPPLNARGRSGDLGGLEVDLARMLALAFDVELEIVEKPFAELLPALKAGEVDMVMSGIGITPERALEVTFVGPYLLSGKSVLTKSEDYASILGLDDLEDEEITLVVLENSTSQTYAKRYLPEAKLVTTKDYDAAIALVLEDEANVMIADMSICLIAARRYEEQGLRTLDQPLTIEPVGVVIGDSDPKFRNLLQSYLSAIQDNGILALLKEKWFEDVSWVGELP
jgi:polar amino acid transport system substrate-binding protein